MTSVGFSWLPSMAVMWGFYPTIENYLLLLKKMWKDTAPFYLRAGLLIEKVLLRHCFVDVPISMHCWGNANQMINPFIFLNSKSFLHIFHLIFSLVWRRLGAPDWLLIFFHAFSTCEHLLHDLLPQQIFCLCYCWLPEAGMGQHPLTALGVALEVLWTELGQRLVRDELWTTTAAEFS